MDALRKNPLIGGAAIVASTALVAFAIDYGLRWWRRQNRVAGGKAVAQSTTDRRPVDAFEAACISARSLASLSIAQRLELYALFKQATEGPCTRPAPSALNMEAHAKWTAWAALGSLPQGDARSAYIAEVARLGNGDAATPLPRSPPPLLASGPAAGDDDDFDGVDAAVLEGQSSAGSGGGGLGAPSQSRPVWEWGSYSGEGAAPDVDPWQCAREGSAEALTDLLDGVGMSPDARNDAGETLLHAAADGGNDANLALLLSRGASVSAAEPEGGCTPLHYAALGGHGRAVAALLAAGADAGARDAEGLLPADHASSPELRAALAPRVPQQPLAAAQG